MNLLQTAAVTAASIDPLLGFVVHKEFFDAKPVSGPLNDLFPEIKDVSTDVPHGAMWEDPRMLNIVEENGIFTK